MNKSSISNKKKANQIDDWLFSNKTVLRYKFIEIIGKGSYGNVFKAHDT
jgi:serine/threonine protein kinase